MARQKLRSGTAVGHAHYSGVPRYFFHLLNDIDAPDDEGAELADLQAAREQAISNLRFTAAETLKEDGRIVPDHCIRIEDANGVVLDTVYVRDVISIEND